MGRGWRLRLGEVAAGRSDIGPRSMWRLRMIAAIVRIAWKFRLMRIFRLHRRQLCVGIRRRNLRQRLLAVGRRHRRHREWPLQAIEGGHLLRRGLLLRRAGNGLRRHRGWLRQVVEGRRRHRGWPLPVVGGHRRRSAVIAAGHHHRSRSSENGLRRRFRRMAPVIACRSRKPTSCVPSWA
uniref:(northern house mosquito) hypothetical protein n=1 Tax=Culex pipiens TaxID=7175 RepID=A0A8D8D140_CULPI